jgi:hypothetical protein
VRVATATPPTASVVPEPSAVVAAAEAEAGTRSRPLVAAKEAAKPIMETV